MSADSHSSPGIVSIALNLTCACLASGLIIAGTYYLTNDMAERKAVELENISRKGLVPDADAFNPVKGKDGWAEALKGGKPMAYIIPSEAKGYAGPVKLIVAVSPDGKVLNFSVLDSKETPGLGDKASKSPFRDQFAGKTLEHLKVVKDPSNKEDVLAITGATITSKAVTKAVAEAVEALSELRKGGKSHE